MRSLLILPILLLVLICRSAVAGVALREINLEWEPIENAKSYELQITPISKSTDVNAPAPKAMSFTVSEPAWSGKLQPGTYSMRLRSRDHRKVPGDWSNQNEFVVALEPIKILSPKNNLKIQSQQLQNDDVKFEWSKPAGAEEFEVVLLDSNQKPVQSFKTKETSWKPSLAVAKSYRLKVKAYDTQGNETEEYAFTDFSIFGPKLEKAQIEKPESAFVRELKWKPVDYADLYTYVISKQDPQSKSFSKIAEVKEYKDSRIAFDPKWPGGTYRLSIKARGYMRAASDVSSITFDVTAGNRSPAAEYQALVKKSIDRTSGWFGIASYLITQISYSNAYQETNTNLDYNAVGGTGRLGAGYFTETSKWGFLGIMDLSGFVFKGNNKTFASLEGSAVYRIQSGTRAEIRLFTGGFYKEMPATIGDVMTQVTEDKILSTIGPQAGIEYWYSLSPKFGMQVNAHMYYSMIKVETPNDQGIKPSMSYQVGAMGSYRVTPQMTGLVGYAYRKDSVKYNKGPITFGTGSENEATVTGHYLNFFAEYDF